MSDAYLNWLFDMVAGPVFMGMAVVGVSALFLILISLFRSLSDARGE